MKTSAIIIDDESMAQNLLKGMLETYHPEIEVLALCDDLPSGIRAIKRNQPKLIFLDIELPGHNGLELVDFFDEDELNFKIIFTTAYNQYALQAFKLSAIDYLLKPIDRKELASAIEKFQKSNDDKQYLQVLKSNLMPERPKVLAVSTASSIHYIPVEHVLYMKAEGAYTKIIYSGSDGILSSKNLGFYEENLSVFGNFFRCHKSYLINLRKVSDFIKADGGTVIIDKQINIPVAQDRKEEFHRLMQQIAIQ
ncbi:MAG: LytTR family DNA-binding domain-containing protein [Bacteroidia bacterium]|nr:LytTR family DNA-binding domain-containing protein [Bacteroidia bacterium]